MLKILRQHHKNVLIILTAIIVPCFALWGGLSYIQERKANTICLIDNHKMSNEEFNYYKTLAKVELYIMQFSSPRDKRQFIPEKIYTVKALQDLLLLWKAKKEHITISDEEVAKTIQSWFSHNGFFDKDAYYSFVREGELRMDFHQFEECVRDILKKDRIAAQYMKKVEVSDAEVRSAYKKDVQQAKIAYVVIPFEKFTHEISVTDQEIKKFYNGQKESFREEPKAKIRYVLLPQESETTKKVLTNMSHIKSIEDIKNQAGSDVKETGFVGLKDPIEGIGWQPQINQIALFLKLKELSSPIATNLGVLFMEKTEEKKSYIPELAEIRNKVEQKIKEQKAKDKVKGAAEALLQRIQTKGMTNLQKIASEQKLEYKETPNFKFYDYIEGVGLDERISKIVFSLKKDQIYPYPIILAKGEYIIQLKGLVALDEKDLQAKKETYREQLARRKENLQTRSVLEQLEKEAKLVYYR